MRHDGRQGGEDQGSERPDQEDRRLFWPGQEDDGRRQDVHRLAQDVRQGQHRPEDYEGHPREVQAHGDVHARGGCQGLVGCRGTLPLDPRDGDLRPRREGGRPQEGAARDCGGRVRRGDEGPRGQAGGAQDCARQAQEHAGQARRARRQEDVARAPVRGLQ